MFKLFGPDPLDFVIFFFLGGGCKLVFGEKKTILKNNCCPLVDCNFCLCSEREDIRDCSEIIPGGFVNDFRLPANKIMVDPLQNLTKYEHPPSLKLKIDNFNI